MSINVYSIVRIIIGPCGACKFLRKKCQDDCIFAPYFDSDQGTADFESVHRIFGASNISELLTNIPIQQRTDAVFTLCLEARARLRDRDPIYGCISDIYTLQDQQTADQNTFAGAPVDGGNGKEFASEFP
ncbi:LOB domain-containing protein 18-like [Impatiens glandulifera]|uniref:LOB domain-containing protein 18-like n=1 Tax=Impatiens glandulifera TaxID=253017 RepID=UPI001FB19E84|nr:LOB domain-containing protein 18-like [Impatiens glandulifera]